MGSMKRLVLLTALALSPAAMADEGEAPKALPDSAAQAAQDNAFGAQGALMREAHPAATDDAEDAKPDALPDSAAEIAKDNAFGAQGARMREAHQAAHAAAVNAARDAAADAVHGRPESPGRSAGHAKGPAAQAADGLARATAAAAAGRARADAARTEHAPPTNTHRP